MSRARRRRSTTGSAQGRPAFVPREGPSPEEVIDIIHRRRRHRVARSSRAARPSTSGFPRSRDAGLDAIEAYHPDHDAALRLRIRRRSRAGSDLLVTGGSDFHGDPGARPRTRLRHAARRRSGNGCSTPVVVIVLSWPRSRSLVALRDVIKDYRGLRPLRVQHLELRQASRWPSLGFDAGDGRGPGQSDHRCARCPTRAKSMCSASRPATSATPDAWLVRDWTGSALLSERAVLLDAVHGRAEPRAAVLAGDRDMPRSPSARSARAREEVGLRPRSCRVSAAALDARRRSCALRLGQARWRSVRGFCSPSIPTRRCRDEAGRVRRRPRSASRRAAGLPLLVMTADSAFARAVCHRTLDAATAQQVSFTHVRLAAVVLAEAVACRDPWNGTWIRPYRAIGDGPRRVYDVANGTIKRLVRDRGFGFIRDDGGQEWFFHRSSVKPAASKQLNEGQRVSFDEEPSQKGPRAGNIRSRRQLDGGVAWAVSGTREPGPAVP